MRRRHLLAGLPALLLARPAWAGFGVAEPAPPAGQAAAIFAGGCFWCLEPPFDKLDGVFSTISGYTGGRTARPTYEEVGQGGSGHYEAVRIVFDPGKVSYARLLEVFWRNIDPEDATGQFCDQGESYRSAVFALDAGQRSAAEASKAALDAAKRFRRPVVTPILEAAPFWPAEDYHQDYYLKNPIRYRFYRSRCGRDERLREVWGTEAGGA